MKKTIFATAFVLFAGSAMADGHNPMSMNFGFGGFGGVDGYVDGGGSPGADFIAGSQSWNDTILAVTLGCGGCGDQYVGFSADLGQDVFGEGHTSSDTSGAVTGTQIFGLADLDAGFHLGSGGFEIGQTVRGLGDTTAIGIGHRVSTNTASVMLLGTEADLEYGGGACGMFGCGDVNYRGSTSAVLSQSASSFATGSGSIFAGSGVDANLNANWGQTITGGAD